MFLAFLYLHVFTVPGILCVQGDYGHFKQKTGAKQTKVLENSLQNTTDGITAAKTTHSLSSCGLRAWASQEPEQEILTGFLNF